MTAASSPYCSPDDIRLALTILMPFIDPYWVRPLRDYAAAAYDPRPNSTRSTTRAHAMGLLLAQVARTAQAAGYDREDARHAGQHLAHVPVLQTGPHCLLLFEPDAFYSHLFSLLGLQSRNQRGHITYAGSTMSFKESAKKGPGWLRLDGESLNLFGLPRSQMDGRSICCSGGTYQFKLSRPEGSGAPNGAAQRLLTELPALMFPSAAEAIRVANQTLWNARFADLANLLQLDDFDAADLIADHLDDRSSWISDFIVAERNTELVPKTIDRLNAGPWRGWVRRTTDYFWYLGPDRVLPLRLDGGYLKGAAPLNVAIEFAPPAIASALRERQLLPNLFLAFLVLSILPGVRALGGCRQPIYLPLMRYIAATVIHRSADTDLLDALAKDDQPGMWGHRVLRPKFGDPFREVETAGVPSLLEGYGAVPLVGASGDLFSFTGDPIWAEMFEHLTAGAISGLSAEWKWSGL